MEGDRTQSLFLSRLHALLPSTARRHKKVFRRMREKYLEPGSKMYGGRKNAGSLFLFPFHSSGSKNIFGKMREKDALAGSKMYGGRKMATRYNITLPNGMKFTLYYSQEQDKAELISK